MSVKDEIIRLEKNIVKEGKMHEIYKEYFADKHDNWFYREMAMEHKIQYGRGSGGELESGKDGRPPKMASLRSSSAMTYNILGNHAVVLKENSCGFVPGQYQIEYEKQLYTLKRGMPANLDAFLYSEKHALFCEMKMMEWICSIPGGLRGAYKDESQYFASETNKRSIEEFCRIIHLLEKEMISCSRIAQNEEIFHFKRYDAWQMFKHMLAIYNHLSAHTAEALKERQRQNKSIDVNMTGKFSTASLVNVVFEPSPDIFSARTKNSYLKLLKEEHEERDIFLEIIQNSGLHEIFREDCGVDFHIKYMTAAEFIDCLEKTEEEKEYLKRYRLGE